MVFLTFFSRTPSNSYLILFQETLFFNRVLITIKEVTNLYLPFRLPLLQILPPNCNNEPRETGKQAPRSYQLHNLPTVVEKVGLSGRWLKSKKYPQKHQTRLFLTSFLFAIRQQGHWTPALHTARCCGAGEPPGSACGKTWPTPNTLDHRNVYGIYDTMSWGYGVFPIQ